MSGARAEAQLALPGVAVDAAAEAEWVWTEDPLEDAVTQEFAHVTVMRDEVRDAVVTLPEMTGVVVDCTLGGVGHTRALLEKAPNVRVIAFDRDDVALASTKVALAASSPATAGGSEVGHSG